MTGSDLPGLPVILDVTDRRCVVVGAGVVGTRKVRSLLAAGADVHVIDPRGCPVDGVTLHERAWTAGDADGAFVAVIATGDPEVNRQATGDARLAGALVLRADAAADGDLRMPATGTSGSLRIAVDSGGATPALAATARRRLVEHLDGDRATWEELAAWAETESTVTVAAAEAKLAEWKGTA